MSSTTNVSKCRQNFHAESELKLNEQVNMELQASYVYQSMAFYFDRDDVALHGFSKFFHKQSEEEREHAEKIMKYINSRGGRIVLKDVKRPDLDEWGNGLSALQTALNLEKQVNASLLSLHAVASSHNDPHLSNYLEEEFLTEQVESIKQLGDMITKLNRAGPQGLGEYIFDKDLQS